MLTKLVYAKLFQIILKYEYTVHSHFVIKIIANIFNHVIRLFKRGTYLYLYQLTHWVLSEVVEGRGQGALNRSFMVRNTNTYQNIRVSPHDFFKHHQPIKAVASLYEAFPT